MGVENDQFLQDLEKDPKMALEHYLSCSGSIHVLPLMKYPAVQNLVQQNPDVGRILEIFSKGTVQDWPENVDISPALLLKLRQLSLISYGSECRLLSYDDLMTKLKLASVRELEDMVIDAIYSNLIRAKLDSKRRLIQICDWTARDANVDKIAEMLVIFEDWLKNSAMVQKECVDRCDKEDQTSRAKVTQKTEREIVVNEAANYLEHQRTTAAQQTPTRVPRRTRNAPVSSAHPDNRMSPGGVSSESAI